MCPDECPLIFHKVHPSILCAHKLTRLLFAVCGYSHADAVGLYKTALHRFVRIQWRRKEKRAAVVVQRAARRLHRVRLEQVAHRASIRRTAALRMLVRLQARFRSRRLRKEEEARATLLTLKRKQRHAVLFVQRWWRDEQMAQQSNQPEARVGTIDKRESEQEARHTSRLRTTAYCGGVGGGASALV